jgi:ABC-type glycerol-3-phosphate transport system substrate-binding protein
MRMMKLSACMAAAFVALTAAGQVHAADVVTLNFWVAWDPQSTDGVAAKSEIAAYEKAHPGVKVDVQNITYDALHSKLLTAIAGGDAPDLSWGLPEWLGELNRMGALRDLTDDAKAWQDEKSIYPNVIDALTVDGHLLAMPHYLGIRALLVHKDMLDAAGIAAPPKTWDELISDSQTVKAKTGKYGFGIAGTGVRSPQELIMYLAQNGVSLAERKADGKYKNTWLDDKEKLARATQVLAFYKRLISDGAINPDGASWGWEEEDTNFSLGQYAMVIDGAWMESREKQSPAEMKDVEIAAPPYKMQPATFFEINPFYVYKAGKHPKETWDFVTFMNGKEFQAAVHPNNSPRSDVSTESKWGKGFTDLASTGVVFPPVALGAVTRDMIESLGRVMLKSEEPEAVARWLAASINKDLKQSGELSGS